MVYRTDRKENAKHYTLWHNMTVRGGWALGME
jgi:hypothetical protein